jgi:hypothetical protein
MFDMKLTMSHSSNSKSYIAIESMLFLANANPILSKAMFYFAFIFINTS